MRLAAIYNLWDGLELAISSARSLERIVDVYIFVWQEKSNFGESNPYGSPIHNPAFPTWPYFKTDTELYQVEFTPTGINGTQNETAKRNLGLEKAKELGCTHFMFVDVDEYWHHPYKALKQYLASGAEGSVAEMYTYFKRPTWRLAGPDNYYVPFIHRLRSDTVAGHRNYKFYCDPTRSVNCESVALIGEKMHHFSWVRRDIEMKARNSSARNNIAASKLMADYNNPALGPGYYVADYQQVLVEVPNIFNIPWPL